MQFRGVFGRVRNRGWKGMGGARGREKGERARERDGERAESETGKASAMLARTYVDRVLNYVLESCTFRVDTPGFV